ncbi:MAG: hypothetical protein K6F95_06035 [Selenomonas sp.]|uniref:hypothetical protein n=1 Tax=Selenomonas sp. TaxID=2053611 RepID=UPI0025FAB7F2|nr:hypothetical protein [Selenomonas sp.]MCR5757446.1 hypothetical protein [Selenomonas sp.]
MSKKLLLAGIVAGIAALGALPVMAPAYYSLDTAGIQQVSQSTQNSQPPKMKNGEQSPEPPKDENGNPLPPPDDKVQGHNGVNQNGEQPPEPPKDKDGNSLPPPDGAQHNQQKDKG